MPKKRRKWGDKTCAGWLGEVSLMLAMMGWPDNAVSTAEMKDAYEKGAAPEEAVMFWTQP